MSLKENLCKSKSIALEEKIVYSVTNQFWETFGCHKLYNLGGITQLKFIAQALGKYGSLEQKDILKLISTYREADGMSDVVDAILEEFDYKED